MDDGRVSYEEAAEAIRKWGNMVHDFSDNDAEIIYANGRPIDDMVREQIRNTLTTYDLEHACVVQVGNFTSIDDVAWLLANGDITLPDARLWCSNTNHSLSDMEEAVGNIRYGQTETLNHVPRHEKKRPWPYRLVAFLNEVIDMFVQAIVEDFL
jgi:hypothetical protein